MHLLRRYIYASSMYLRKYGWLLYVRVKLVMMLSMGQVLTYFTLPSWPPHLTTSTGDVLLSISIDFTLLKNTGPFNDDHFNGESTMLQLLIFTLCCFAELGNCRYCIGRVWPICWIFGYRTWCFFFQIYYFSLRSIRWVDDKGIFGRRPPGRDLFTCVLGCDFRIHFDFDAVLWTRCCVDATCTEANVTENGSISSLFEWCAFISLPWQMLFGN